LWWSAVLLITLVTCGWVEPMSASPSRRRLLQAALLSPVAAACTTKRDKDDGPVDPDVAIRAAAVAREERLLDLYSAAAPGVAGTLASIRAEHEAHLDALRPRSASPSASTGSPRSLPAVALPALVRAERAAAAEHAAAALTASRPLAALLASLAGSEASHAVVLT
jgi:hypothetical protein